MVDDMKQIRKSCNLRCVFHRGMVDDTKQIRKCSNLDCVFHHGVVSFPVFSVVVCAWSMTRNLRGQLASVGLAHARPNHTVNPLKYVEGNQELCVHHYHHKHT